MNFIVLSNAYILGQISNTLKILHYFVPNLSILRFLHFGTVRQKSIFLIDYAWVPVYNAPRSLMRIHHVKPTYGW